MILYNARIITMNEKEEILYPGWVKIENGIIEDIGKGEYSGNNGIDCNGDILMPGFINGHTHSAMTLLRGYADDLSLEEWLNNHIWPFENKYMNKDNVVLGLKLAMLEMLRCGTTTFCDMYFFIKDTLEIVEKAGMRGLMAEGIIDFPTPNMKKPEHAFNYVKDIIKNKYSIAKPVISVHAPYTTSAEYIERASDLARENDTLFVIHTAETKWEVDEIKKRYNKTPVEYLNDLIKKQTKTVMAHMVHLSENDMHIAAERNFNAIHNPQSNLKLSSGIAKIEEMRKRGIKISIGTDGAASNNNLDIVEEMRVAALIGKLNNPKYVSAKDTVKMATIEGAKALHIDSITGSLEKNKSADIIRISTKGIESYPYYDNPYSFIVYALNSRDIVMTMVNGKILFENNEYKTLDEEKIKFEIRHFERSVKS